VDIIKRNGWGWAADEIFVRRAGVEIDSNTVGEAATIVDFSIALGHWEILHDGAIPTY